MDNFIRLPFADSGDKTEIPVSQQSDNSVSYAQGYTLSYSLDPNTDASARRIEREKMNQLFHDITSAIHELQVNGVAPFITSDNNNGSAFSYAKGAVVSYNGVIYQSLVNANTELPTVLANWSPLLTGSAAFGRFLNVQILLGSGTYVPTAGTSKVMIEACGGGAGGGGSSAGGQSGSNYTYSVGGGGGSGSYAKFILTSGFSNIAFQCGKGGLGGNKPGAPNQNGSAGGQTTFGSILTAPGGGGGYSSLTNTAFDAGTVAGGGFGADVPTLSSAAKIVISMGGAVGGAGNMNNGNGGCAGVGANDILGYGGFGATNGPGGESRGYGSGGGGALNTISNGTAQAGGNGADGVIIVWEYA